ncbi:MAG: DUF4035 domain-containing protein [Sulfuriferula sp.]
MSAAELSELRHFHDLEPLGGARGDVQAGIIASIIANVNRGKNTDPFTVLDFMPFAERPAKAEPEPTLLPDAEAQSRLIMAAVFGKTE